MVRTEKDCKLDAKSRCVFAGCAEHMKAFKRIDEETETVIIPRDSAFKDSRLEFPEMTSSVRNEP